MLGFLFRRLTAEPKRGEALFAAVTRIARRPHWFVEGQVPDTIDGRFAVLATITALAILRLECDGDHGNAGAVALTERFIEVMEAEHREIGLGDPTLGKTVRKLVGSLARRTEAWRGVAAAGDGWQAAVRQSLYKGAVSPRALEHSTAALEGAWDALRRTPLEDMIKGVVE